MPSMQINFSLAVFFNSRGHNDSNMEVVQIRLYKSDYTCV